MDPEYDHIFDDLYNVQSNRDYPDRARVFEAGVFTSDEPVATVRRTIDDADLRLVNYERLRLSAPLRCRPESRFRYSSAKDGPTNGDRPFCHE